MERITYVVYIFALVIFSFSVTAHQFDDIYLPIKAKVGISVQNNMTFEAYFGKCSKYNRTPYFNVCMSPYYKDLAKTRNAGEVLNLAESRVSKTEGFNSDCHFIGHEIGAVVYHKNNGNLFNSIKECGDVWLCGGGCHHQIFIEFMDNKSMSDLVRARDLICPGKNESLPEGFEYTCYHSFGHSISLYFEFDPEKAKQFCDGLNNEYAYECLDGLYHENYFRHLDRDFEDIEKSPNLLCPKNLKGIELKACYERAGKFALTYYGYHNKLVFPKGLELCSKFGFIKNIRCLNGLFTYVEDCAKSKYQCSYLSAKTKILNWILDFFVYNKMLHYKSKNYDFYEGYYVDLVKKSGVDTTFRDLKSDYEINGVVRSNCHQIAHAIGRAAAKKYGNAGNAFKFGDSFCWSGYYHGVMEGLVSEIGLNNLTKNINIICSNIKGKENFSFDYYNCVHGLGHGIMYIDSNELFDSLKECDTLVGWWEQNSCYGGVFMENIITDDKNHFTNYLKQGDVYYPCNAVEEKYAYQCYLMQTSHMLDVIDWDFAKVFELCAQLDERFGDICYQSLGRDASGYTESNVDETKKLCLLGKNYKQRAYCIIGAAKDFVAYYHSDIQARRLCESLPIELQNSCYGAVGELSSNL